MAKLYFRYGAMGSSKTANALMVYYNYMEKGKKAIILKPAIENRNGKTIIKSRIGISAECVLAEEFLKHAETELENLSAIIVDEAQFLSEDQVYELSNIVDRFNISIICYGLKTDFSGRLFEGSKRLMELADEIEEIPTICWCGKKAKFNARVKDGKILRTGDQIMMGGNDSYISLCRKHYTSGQLKRNETYV